MTYILGISAFYHDSGAALIKDGNILSAIQEERMTRVKHDESFPINAIKEILRYENISLSDIDYICYYEKPFLKFERILETYLAYAPYSFKMFRKSMPVWLKEKLFQKNFISNQLKKIDNTFDKNIHFSEHHLSHAASAFFPSPYEKSIILTIDGVGEWATTTISVGNKNQIKTVEEIHYPHSIGLLYSAFTFYLGFKVNSGEYKVMGLAPYGKPIYEKIILEELIDLKNDGSFRLNQKFFDYSLGDKMIGANFEKLFGRSSRKPEIENINQFHMDVAASIQVVIEKIILRITDYIYENYEYDNLCLAGGVALNCVANSKILLQGKFKNIWIQPASGDAGGAVGAALSIWHQKLKKERIINSIDKMQGSFLGPSYSETEIQNELNEIDAKYTKHSEDETIKKTAVLLSKGKTIGWFQGRMEFGPRALGGRSIIADPRSETMQTELNLKIKFRESFRPFAPSILDSEVNKWFELEDESPYMLLVSEIKNNKRLSLKEDELKLEGIDLLNLKRSVVPAITHVDYSARVQTVHKETNARYYKLLYEFNKITGCPILVNTSFNVRGEPIVCSPIDAYRCFMGTNLDFLIIENFILDKQEQQVAGFTTYKDNYELD